METFHSDTHGEDENPQVIGMQRLAWFLEAHFRQSCICTDEPEQGEDSHEPSLLVRLKDEADALINLLSMIVTSTNEALKKRVEAVLDMALPTVSSLNEAFTSGIPCLPKKLSQRC
ncbi:hypothetical protein A0H81_11972 [Grifola frondosa]|uniref:Pre-mRNA 3'-end-processing endonuclease polyadenylation factor C-term domain-containing protein n=1 Tax=Grifola frondosa TaxID=5627 RepID=A0A1C7LWC0_GRIFR|nr:hypothetical protein A0H81_11972 [Grifola frondosa]